MRSQADDELRALRERVYGPNGGMQDDVAALRRLRELEMREQALTLAVEDEPENDSAVPPEEPVLPAAAMTVTPKPPLHGKSRWRLPALWVASVLVAIIATALVSKAVIQRVQVDPYDVGAMQIARLSMEPGSEVPGSFTLDGTVDTRVFSEFYDLQVLVSPDGSLLGQNSDECILVMQSDSYAAATDDSFSGPIFSGCAANDFPALVTMKVTRDISEELLSDYPEGTALQFVFDKTGSDIVVFSSAN